MFEHEVESFRVVIMRGGTSKAIFFLENDLPKDPILRDKVILSVFGSPDSRQIDGLGGADPLTSKLAILAPSTRDNADVDYTFGAVDINSAFVDYSSNCGNISSAVGPYAIEQSLVKAEEPITKVRIYNTNTAKYYVSNVPVVNGKPKVAGDFKIDGVPRPGAKIELDFAGTAGSKTGKILPTGNVKDVLVVDGIGELVVSMVDAANPMVFLAAADLGLTAKETAQEIDGNKGLLEKLEIIRALSAEKMGLVKKWEDAVVGMKSIPMLAFVAPPDSYYNAIKGVTTPGDSIDFLSRNMYMQVLHKTYAGTASVCTGVAAMIPGTIVNDVMRKNKNDNLVRIGHPGGVMSIEICIEKENGELVLKRAVVGRTSRRIMEGYVFVPTSSLL